MKKLLNSKALVIIVNILNDCTETHWKVADYHFYREMVTKRKQKSTFKRLLEIPLQYLFGYGVYPMRLFSTWLGMIMLYALGYWVGGGIVGAGAFFECFYFSVVTAATPGYGGYHPKPGIFQSLAGMEAIFGTFMWAAFITTFARKYMR